MTHRRHFPNDPRAVRAARRFAVETLAGSPANELEVVELLVSELAGNCVRHTESAFSVEVSGDGGRIRVAVSDDGAGQPAAQRVDPSAVAGRGLALVEALSDAWGVRRNGIGRRGKTVWFELRPGESRVADERVA